MPYIHPDVPRPRSITRSTQHALPEVGRRTQLRLSRLAKRYVDENGGDYQAMNDVMGAFDGASREFYRRTVAPYEDARFAERRRRMKRLDYPRAAGASPAAAVTTPTSPAALDDLAKVLEQSGPDAALDKQLLTLLREPAKTLDGITLPTTAAQYTATVDTALKLRPKGWLTGFSEEFPAAAGGVSCTAHLSLWVIDDSTWSPHRGVRVGQGQLRRRAGRRHRAGLGFPPPPSGEDLMLEPWTKTDARTSNPAEQQYLDL
jgi:hypothetical protein